MSLKFSTTTRSSLMLVTGVFLFASGLALLGASVLGFMQYRSHVENKIRIRDQEKILFYLLRQVDIDEVQFRNSDDGKMITAYLYRPKDVENVSHLPALVVGRGAGDANVQHERWQVFLARYASLGNVALFPMDPRLDQYKTRGWTDYDAAVRYLRDEKSISHIACSGSSYSNESILKLVQETRDCEAYVNIAGALPLPEDEHLILPAQMKKLLDPTLYIVGGEDGQKITFQNILIEQMGKYVPETPRHQLIYEGMSHGFMIAPYLSDEQIEAADAAQLSMIEFLDWQLKDTAQPDWYEWPPSQP